jgi:phosphoglycolate phosphatase
MTAHPHPPDTRPHRLALWNIDLTLVDVGRVTRAAFADAFERVTGRPLVRLPQMAGSTESEIFFEALELNSAGRGSPSPSSSGAGDEALLAQFSDELVTAFTARSGQLTKQGRLLPGALAAVAAVGELPGLVQTVLTGAIERNTIVKLRAFGLAGYFDTAVGGYGSGVYPKGAMLLNTRGRAAAKYATDFTEDSTVYIADSPRDVEAARVGGARSMAVASGRASEGELREAGADVVLPDLADTAAVVQAVDDLTITFRT